ncbi:MAG: nitroreductase [Nonlabens sp.]
MSNAIIEAIKNRRSIFPSSYVDGGIEMDDLKTILDSARFAPNHKKTEPWRYRVFHSEGLKRLGIFMQDEFERTQNKKPSIKVRKMADKIEESAAVILIFMNRDIKESIPEWEEIAAVSMSVQNMWITASSLGYGAYWSSPKSFADMSRMGELEVGERYRFLGFFYIGNLEQQTTALPDRKSVNEIASFHD